MGQLPKGTGHAVSIAEPHGELEYVEPKCKALKGGLENPTTALSVPLLQKDVEVRRCFGVADA